MWVISPHVNQKSNSVFLCIAWTLLCNNMADCQDLCVYKRLKTNIQCIVYFKKEKHGEFGGGGAVDINCTAYICR